MNVIFIVPCYNMSSNFDKLISSIISQNDDRWMCTMIDDISEDDTWNKISNLCLNNEKFHGIKNKNKKFALRNIVETSRLFQDRDVVIAVIDGDDQLCNDDTVSLLLDEYDSGSDIVWTAHEWDINGMNISKSMPANVDPYMWPWCSSHLRTFRSSLIRDISDENFLNPIGEWFKRGYDQALMLPILSQTDNRKYIDKVCYKYNINSVSIKDRNWEETSQISTINIVRARGFLN
jgi:glycosyltransferase involved in cell wall biosynthesis